MILVVDAGNTNITLGVFREEELLGTFRMTTKIPRTSDEYGIFIIDLLEKNGIDAKQVKDVIISSVVPNIMHSFVSGIMKYFSLLKIEQAKLFLHGGKYNISQIAELLGYDSVHYFSKHFKSVEGVSPSGYLKSKEKD